MQPRSFGLLANGPSATAEDALKLRSVVDVLIAINDAYKLCKGSDGEYFADAIYGTDHRWWAWAYPHVMQVFDGELITQRVQWPFAAEDWGMACYESEAKPGLCTEPGKIHTGSNSGYAAINVAYHMGAKRIYLLGYDMGMRGNRRHAVSDRPENLNVSSDYASFCRHFATIKPADYNLEIINLSRQTALNAFPLGDLDKLCVALFPPGAEPLQMPAS